jgi:dipeptidyl aminopeptidase/acylaminoacyl peptidase
VSRGLGYVLGAAALAVAASCGRTLPPLRGHLQVGRDAYAVFVGGTAPAGGDLYAVPATGGEAIPITFTNVGEMRPRLSPDGRFIVFLRGGSLTDSTPSSVWVLGLDNGAERELTLPRGAPPPRQAAWSKDGQTVVVAAGQHLYRYDAPMTSSDGRVVEPAERAEAESSLAVLLGDPVFARVVPCERGSLCTVGDSGRDLLATDARDPLRWGPDSVAWFSDDGVEIRPVGPGRSRRLEIEGPRAPRQMTAFTGRAAP